MKHLVKSLAFLLALTANAYAAPVQFMGGETGSAGDEPALVLGTASLVTSPVKTGTYAYSLATGTGGGASFRIYCLNAFGNASACSVADAHLKFDMWVATLPTATQASVDLFVAENTGYSPKARLSLTSGGFLRVKNQAGTTLATGSTAITTGAWNRIEFKFLTGVAAAYEVKINGTTELSGTGDFTASNMGGDTAMSTGAALTDGTVDIIVDNIVLDDAAFPGDLVVKRMAPNADGSTAQWTAGTSPSDYTTVDEVPASNIDYTMSSTAGSQTGLLNLASSATAGISGTVSAVKSFLQMRSNVVSTTSTVMRIREAATNADTTALNVPITDTNLFQLRTTKPSGGAWTTGVLDSTEIGASEANAVSVRMNAAGLLVLYSPIVGTATPTPTVTHTFTPGPSPTPTVTPTPTPYPTIPAQVPFKQEWKDQWIEWSQRKYDYLVTQNGWTSPSDTSSQFQQVAHYYDATRNMLVMPTIVATPASAATRIAVLRRSYRDSYVIPNNGGANGYTVFTGGLRKDWELFGDATSRNAIFLLSRNSAYSVAGIPITWTEDPIGEPPSNESSYGGSREAAYRIIAELDARAVGYTARPELDAWLDQALRHLNRWTVVQDTAYVRVFMVALTCKALIQAYEEYPSYASRGSIPAAIATAYDYLWDTSWVPYDVGNPISRSFTYTDRETGGTDPPDRVGQPDLNGIILPPMGWLYSITGDAKWRVRGDEVFRGLIAEYDVFGGWVRGPYLGPKSVSFNGAKQFNQTYQWSYEYIRWAESPPGTTPTPAPTATATPTRTPTRTPTPAPTQTPGTAPTVTPVATATALPGVTLTPGVKPGGPTKRFTPNSPFAPCNSNCCRRNTCPAECGVNFCLQFPWYVAPSDRVFRPYTGE